MIAQVSGRWNADITRDWPSPELQRLGTSRVLASSGHPQISLDDLVRLRSHDVTLARIKAANDRARTKSCQWTNWFTWRLMDGRE